MGFSKNVSGVVSGSKLSPLFLIIRDGQFPTVLFTVWLGELMLSWAENLGENQSWFSLDSRLTESRFLALNSRHSVSQQRPGSRPGRHRTSSPD